MQLGEFAFRTLEAWKSCQKYYLVDLWAFQVCVCRSCYISLARPCNVMALAVTG